MDLFFYCPNFNGNKGIRNYVLTPDGWVEYNNWVTRENLFEPLPEWMDNFIGWNLVYYVEGEGARKNVEIRSEHIKGYEDYAQNQFKF